MKMAKWVLSDDQNGIVSILRTDNSDVVASSKTIYKKSKAEFKLLYSDTGKMLGYQLEYNKDKKYPRFSNFNVFFISFNTRINDSKSVEVLFEDQVVRLLAYEYADKSRDYLLVGRWRTENVEDQDAEQ